MPSQIVKHVTIREGADGTTRDVPIVPDGRDGLDVYARPARQDEEPGVEITQGETLVFRYEVSHVWLKDNPNPVRVIPDGRDGLTVFVRPLGPSEEDTGEVVKFIPGREELVVTTHITHAGLHLTDQVGRTDDLLTAVRVVPAGRDGSTVYMRTLGKGETDTGETVRIAPGDRPVFRAGDFVLDLDAIDARESEPAADGYAPITNILWTWIAIFGPVTADGARFLLATSRRLDAAHQLLCSMRTGLEES